MQITIASIELKEKRSIVVTTDGRKLGCWTDKIGKFDLKRDQTYEIETEATDFNGRTLTNIVKAKQIASTSPPPPTSANGGGSSAAFRTPEQMFVSEILVAYIASGRCETPAKLTETINHIRVAWNKTFGGRDGCFAASEAGHYHMEAAE